MTSTVAGSGIDLEVVTCAAAGSWVDLDATSRPQKQDLMSVNTQHCDLRLRICWRSVEGLTLTLQLAQSLDQELMLTLRPAQLLDLGSTLIFLFAQLREQEVEIILKCENPFLRVHTLSLGQKLNYNGVFLSS